MASQIGQVHAPVPLPFRALPLSAQMNEDGDGDADEDDNDDGEAHGDSGRPRTEPRRAASASGQGQGQKQEAKKKKGKKAQAAGRPLRQPDGPDEIDLALVEVANGLAAASIADSRTAAKHAEELLRLLGINPHHLKVANEMRSVFGRETIEAAEAEDRSERSASRRQQQQQREHVDLEGFLRGDAAGSARKVPDVLAKRNPFMQWKNTWPPGTSGRPLDAVLLPPGNERRRVQIRARQGLRAVGGPVLQLRSDARSAADVHVPQSKPCVPLVKTPADELQGADQYISSAAYHVSSLIQVSKIAKQDQNSALAADLCERALYTFGRVTLSSFRKKLGRVRLG